MRPKTIATLILAATLLTLIAYLRPPEYDEAYSIFLTAGHARPAWPTTPFHPAAIKPLYAGPTTLTRIAENLRQGDVHPPLYFWLLNFWRDSFGPSWFTARLFSILTAIATLAILASLACTLRIPPIPTIILCLLTYGFAYTAIIARGFSLAQLLLLLGVTLIFRTVRRKSEADPAISPPAFVSLPLAGLAFGAATFTNYLTFFTALTALAYLSLKSPRKALMAWLPFAAFLPADAWFFAVQRHSRAHQFAPFSLPHAIALTAKDFAAAWLGGLPLYAGPFAFPVTAALIALAATTLICIARNRLTSTLPLAALAFATPAGLLALGLIFHNTPIEIRYLAFSLPYLSLLIAATAPRFLLITLISIQSLAIIGLALSPITAQPQAAAAKQAAALATSKTLILLPFGNDGVGIPGPFLATALPVSRLLLLHPDTPPNLADETSLSLATITIDDASRRAVGQTQALLKSDPCWRLETTTPLVQTYQNACANNGR